MNNIMISQAFRSDNSKRRSQRHRNKVPKRKSADYSIPNPYRIDNTHDMLPLNLEKQLVGLESLSTKSLKEISYDTLAYDENMGDLLFKMKNAVRKQ